MGKSAKTFVVKNLNGISITPSHAPVDFDLLSCFCPAGQVKHEISQKYYLKMPPLIIEQVGKKVLSIFLDAMTLLVYMKNDPLFCERIFTLYFAKCRYLIAWHPQK